MKYENVVGKKLSFKKGDKVPEWMYEKGKFGADLIVYPKKHEVICRLPTGLKPGEALIEETSNNFCEQKCPELFYEIGKKETGRDVED